MSQLTKNQLGTENSNSFPNNNTGYITPTLLRTFNQNMIDSLVDEDSYTVESGSFNARINALDPSGSATSILALNQFTASQYVSNSLFIQSSQTSSMSVLSSSFAQTASYALNTQNIDTGSLVTTSSFNSYTASASTNVSASINAATQSLSASLTLTDNSKLNTSSFNTYTASAATNVSGAINSATQSLSASLTTTINGISGKTGSYATTGSNTFVGNQIVSGNLNISGNITAISASFQYVETIFETASTVYSSGSNQFGDASDDIQTLYGSVRVINALTASKLEVNGVTDLNGVLDVSNDATFRGDVLIQSSGEQKLKMRSTSGGGVSQGFDLLIQTSSFIIRDETHNIDFFEFDYNSGSTDHTLKLEANRFELNSGSLGVSGSFTASLAEGYVWVGGVGNVSTAISTASFGGSINTGSFATTASNTFIGNQIISGNLLVSGANINLEVDPPALSVGVTNVKTILDASASAIITSLDLTRLGAGPTGDLTAIRLQTFSGSSDTSGDRLLSRITTGVNRHTSLGLSGSVVNTQVNAVWATGSSAFTSQIVETAQSGSATLSINVGNLAASNEAGTASIAAGLIRIGTNVAHTISSTGSFGPMILVAPLNTPAIAIRSGSFELTTPQGSGSFYSNCPITSSGLRINGDGRFSGIEVVGLAGANGSGSIAVEKNVIVSGSIIISGSGTLTLTGSYAGNLGFSGSVITNLGSIYTASNAITNIVNIGSASYSQLSSSAGTNANTLYIIEGGDSYLLSSQTSSFATTGSNTFKASQTISGSVYGEVKALSISSTTASLDLSIGNFFTLQLVSGAATNINPTNIRPGQTINIRLNTTGSGTVTFPSSVKQISGSAYTPTTTTGVDIITLIAFDTTNLYLANVKNLI
jgi:hypothetical protein